MERARRSRRVFLRDSSTIIAGLCVGALASSGCGPEGTERAIVEPATGSSGVLNYNPRMGYRRLGKTGLTVSEIVLDGRFGDPSGRRFQVGLTDGDVPAEVVKGRTEVVSRGLDCGINYLDITSGAEALAYRAALKGRREQMYIGADDVAYCMRHERHRNADSQMQSIESCLSKLGTDYLDIWRPQCKEMDGHRDIEMEMCIGVFEKARKQGKVRYLGMDTRDRTWILHVIERFRQYEVIYTPYTLRSEAKPSDLKSIDREQLYEPSRWGGRRKDAGGRLFEAAKAQDVGVIATEPFRPRSEPGGAAQTDEHLEQARLTLAYILSNPGLSAVAVEMVLPVHVENYVRASFERRGEAS